jgi:hypothetical protein
MVGFFLKQGNNKQTNKQKQSSCLAGKGMGLYTIKIENLFLLSNSALRIQNS